MYTYICIRELVCSGMYTHLIVCWQAEATAQYDPSQAGKITYSLKNQHSKLPDEVDYFVKWNTGMHVLKASEPIAIFNRRY